MKRHPWWTRSLLLVLVTVAGVTALVLGLTTQEISVFLGVVLAAFAAVLNFEIVDRGEDKTTVLDDPLDKNGLPLLSWKQVEHMTNGEISAPGSEAHELSDEDLAALDQT